MKLSHTLNDEPSMQAFGKKLASFIMPGTIIFLKGPLGAGKTTLARAFLKSAGITEKIKSPSYTIVESYEHNQISYFHFDFYRIQHAQELLHIGIEEYFTPNSICLIEWPENAIDILPPADLIIQIQILDSKRQLDIEVLSEKAKIIINP